MDKPKKYIRGIPTFYGVYEDYKQEVKDYGGRGWNQKTTAQYDQIVLDHIMPYLTNHNIKHIGELTKADFDKAYKSLLKTGKNAPGLPYEPWDADGVPEKVDFLFRAVVYTAAQHSLCEDCYRKNPDSSAKEKKPAGGRAQARVKKCLTILQEKMVVKYIMKLIYSVGTAAGLLLQYALGLRNNESCGVNFGYIREYENYPGHYYLIIPQTTDLGSNTVKILGKTQNSGRKIPLPALLAKVLLKLYSIRSDMARASGYEGELEDLPIACRNKPWVRCSSDDLSYAAKDMFVQIGMRHDEIVALNQELLEEAQAAKEEMEEDEFREIESNPTAYLLRRNFATHLAKLMLSDPEIWYVIGHKIEDPYVQRKAFNDEKLLFDLKRKLDQRPILNPIVKEQFIELRPGEVVQLEGSRKLLLEIPVEQLQNAELTMTTKEPGDAIKVRIVPKLSNGGVNVTFKSHSSPMPEKPPRTIDGTRAYLGAYQTAGVKDISEYEA